MRISSLYNHTYSPIDRTHNKEVLLLAKKIRMEEEQKLLENKDGYRLKKDRQINFLSYFQAYIDGYTKKDVRMIKNCLAAFCGFLKRYPRV